jgi:hypothetical protein
MFEKASLLSVCLMILRHRISFGNLPMLENKIDEASHVSHAILRRLRIIVGRLIYHLREFHLDTKPCQKPLNVKPRELG